MNLDEVLALAGDRGLSELERARARRATRRVQQEYQRAESVGIDPISDVDVRDPLADDVDEAARISRAAQLAKLGSLWWNRSDGELRWSDEMSLVFGYAPGTVRPSVGLLARLIHPDDLADARRTVESAWRTETARETTFRVVRPDKVIRYVSVLVEIVVDQRNRPSGIVAIGQDVTEAELARQERVRLARRRETVRTELTARDPGDEPLSRPRFVEEIDAARRAGPGVLLVVAVAPVGPVRAGARSGYPDTSGVHPVHPDLAGGDDHDRLDAAVGAVVRRAIRRGDLCGRTAPGEFGVLMHRTTLGAARAVAEAVVAGIRHQSFLLGRNRLRLHAWAGLIRYPGRHGSRALDVLLDAEAAWRLARVAGVDCVAPGEAAGGTERTAGAAPVPPPVHRFTLHTRPILDLRLNQITRQEILLRLVDEGAARHRKAGPAGTARPVDEAIPPLDRWVVDHAVELVARGARTSHYQVSLSDQSPGDPELLEHLQQQLRRHDVDPAQFTFVISEAALTGDLTSAVDFAHGLRQLGCQLALDDFDPGRADVDALTYLPVDLVRLDGELTSGLHLSRPHRRAVRSVVETCRELGIRTAAQQVREPAIRDLLRDYGVDFAQGYLVGRPKPVTGPHRTSSAGGGPVRPDPAVRPSAVPW
ncbi:EAL domain-containing protein [Plantactinospora sp. B5E13]|uniref:EAL domain-containing protein n=1 Tax=Plantactinospora sp. B5E13 TaxID=3153758 RepID=UPI00325C9263